MQLVRSIDTLNNKLDTIIRLLSQNAPQKPKKDKSKAPKQTVVPQEDASGSEVAAAFTPLEVEPTQEVVVQQDPQPSVEE